MCGRYIISENDDNVDFKLIFEELNREYNENLSKYRTGEIFPSDMAPVVLDERSNKQYINVFRWGFPGYNNELIINARNETLGQKLMFKNLLNSNRCLIPASGFYEWQKNSDKKTKYIIKPKDCSFFYMAGLYNKFFNKDDNPFYAFVIITTEANEQMRLIHSRMPLIFNKHEGEMWLSGMNSHISDVMTKTKSLIINRI
jgi:putative SOS response-associated peptidase YedK